MNTPIKRYVELVTERTVERFLLRLFLRDARLKGLYIIAPYISPNSDSRFSLVNLRKKVEGEQVPTYVVTREPEEPYQHEAMGVLKDSPWIEVRYNASIHAKVYVVAAEREADSFALFGSGNLSTKSIESNVEMGMLIYSEGPGRELLRELHYWASVRLRTLAASEIKQHIRARRV